MDKTSRMERKEDESHLVRDKKEWQPRRKEYSEQRQGYGRAHNKSPGGTGPYGTPTCNGAGGK